MTFANIAGIGAVPSERDDEEYIDELLDLILDAKFKYNSGIWEFVDGISS